MKEKVIFMPRMAYALVDRGFPIIRQETNYKDPRYKVFIFEETDELIQTMISLSNKWKGVR